MRHYMVDLETMSLENNAAIVQIGVTEFDEYGAGRNFTRNVSLGTSVDAGLHLDANTISWWMNQTKKTWMKDPIDLVQALGHLSRWIDDDGKQDGNLTIWGDGAAFDPAVLESAYEAIGFPRWWKYNQVRCYRTMKNLFPDIIRIEKADHDALGDAFQQAQHLVHICRVHNIDLNAVQAEKGK